MVLIDTSVWVDFFNGIDSTHTKCLRKLIAKEQEEIFYTGLILQEILQGIHLKKQRQQIFSDFEEFILIQPSLETHANAAEIFVSCREKGLTIRKSVDCVIASIALEFDLEVLHRDRDFMHISKVFPLKIRI